ncbi:Sodium-independent sulfate anion transporter [Daphnia magna]|uniref:Sodium-independent sulfate anion transporter n=1 Tax=Daphnia magna TaxID=35525 RepID=A0A0P5EN33_9CRUS|nr:Sodium-independent sulfate anion transporter [Daphnia magna]
MEKATEKKDNSGSETEDCSAKAPQTTVTVIRLKAKHDGGDGSPPQPWWRKRKERIFRKKTLYSRFPILKWLPVYSAQDFVADLVAGITIGVTVIPQGLAYATVAGLPPQYGLYASYMGCLVYALLGSTHAITIGPTALMALVTYDSGATLMGPEAAVLLAFLTGCIVLLLGLLNFGFLIDFIAAPVVAGFTSASAFTIATTQIESLLGLKFEEEGFLHTWIAVFEHIEETKKWDAVLGFSSVAVLLLLRIFDQIQLGKEGEMTRWQRWFNSGCWLISVSRNAIVIIVGSLIAYALTEPGSDSYPFTLTGTIPGGFPPFKLPAFSIQNGDESYTFVEICKNLGSSLYVAPLVAVLESIAIAKAFAKGKRVDASQEMIAIGTSNILGSFASSFPITGSFSRTSVNASSGVRTPFGGLYTAALVILAITVLTPYFFFIPKSCLAAVIICAVIFMVEVHLVKMVWRSKRIDLIPFGVTFVFCLFVGLEQGILIGTAVNLGMLLYSTARPRIRIHKIQTPSVEYLLITPDRSLVFTAMEYFMSSVRKSSALYPGIIVVMDMSHVSSADFTTAYGFENMIKSLHKHHHKLVLTKTKPDVLRILSRMGCDLHVHGDGTDLELLLKDVATSTSTPVRLSVASSSSSSSSDGQSSQVEETSVNVSIDPDLEK